MSDYWAAAAERWQEYRDKVWSPLGSWSSIPVPWLQGKRRVIVSRKPLGHSWFVSDSSQLSNPGNHNVYARGQCLFFGQAIRQAEAALAGLSEPVPTISRAT